MLEYEVYFPKNFDFVMGGKLPGLHGGNLQCSGYSIVPNGNNCFSTRLMWREDGEGEAYMYVDLKDQKDDFCAQCSYPVASKCSAFSGVENCSWNRGTFKFQKGKWHRVAQYIKMNTPGKQDGVFEVSIVPICPAPSASSLLHFPLSCFLCCLVRFACSQHVETQAAKPLFLAQVYVDGTKRMSYSQMLFRKTANLHLEGLYFSTFMGGHSRAYAPGGTQSSFFRGFKIYAN